jgi:hypothetical protein
MFEGSEVVKEGVWLYDGTVACGVTIAKHHVWYGTGDYEDPPEICDDREVECYYIWYESLVEPGRFSTGGGVFSTLAEAMECVERWTNGTVRWKE